MTTGKFLAEHRRNKLLRYLRDTWQLYLFVLPAVLLCFLFKYVPIYGLQIAFRKRSLAGGFFGGAFNGLDNFRRFFTVYNSSEILLNTVLLSGGRLLCTFPIPILFALMLNQVRSSRYKKLVQTVSYAPHLISIVVLCGMMYIMLSPSSGVINHIIRALGGTEIYFLGSKEWFLPVYILSDIWRDTGFDAVIYIAALSTVDTQQVEAGYIDGINTLQKIRYIDLPNIMPTIIIVMILRIGSMMEIGFEKILLLQNSMNIERAEIISSYVYKAGIVQGDYNFGAAVGLMNSLVNVIMLVFANTVSRRVTGESLY